MGALLLLAADYRIGVAGPFRITANEVAIGVTMPQAGIELCQARLAPAAFSRAVMLAEVYSPEDAAATGRLPHLDRRAHVTTKLRARQALIESVTAAAQAEFGPAGAA
jgi:enoyl-CoA hydratase